MTTRARDVDDLVVRLRQFVDLLIERDHARIGVHEDVAECQRDLSDAFKRVLGMKVAEHTE
jgi:hypothetical protein